VIGKEMNLENRKELLKGSQMVTVTKKVAEIVLQMLEQD